VHEDDFNGWEGEKSPPDRILTLIPTSVDPYPALPSFLSFTGHPVLPIAGYNYHGMIDQALKGFKRTKIDWDTVEGKKLFRDG